MVHKVVKKAEELKHIEGLTDYQRLDLAIKILSAKKDSKEVIREYMEAG